MKNKTKRSSKWIKEDCAGIHIIAEFWGGREIKKEEEFEKILIQASLLAETRPLKTYIHKFSPQGMTGVVVLEESHITFHSWPEIKYLALDIFTCGDSKPYKALDYIREKIKPKNVQLMEIKRGLYDRS
jgi:S-adenosylmethionine decarboxylase